MKNCMKIYEDVLGRRNERGGKIRVDLLKGEDWLSEN